MTTNSEINAETTAQTTGMQTRNRRLRLFVSRDILRKLPKWTEKSGPIRTHGRGSTIIPDFVGKTFEVHTGKTFSKVSITADMIGRKLGEFAPTRKFKGHSGKTAKAVKR